MSIYYPKEDKIYFSQSKKNFEEVVSCYSSGNYRAAVVLLYSIAICDMLLKLQELKDMYNDTVAAEILDFYESNRYQSTRSRSSWEKEFVDKVFEKTELLDLESLTHLNHLYDDRNFSAHPALNDNYELIRPSKETTLSHILNILDDILTKPPILIKNIVDTITEDLKEKKYVFDGNDKDLELYLNNRYYNKMTNAMKLKLFKAFWKFCFIKYDNQDCMDNIKINRKALAVLIKSCDKSFYTLLKNESEMLTVAENDKCKNNLIVLLSDCEELYPYLSSITKLQLEKSINEEDALKCICWFKFGSFKDHLTYLYKEVDDIPGRPNGLVEHMVEHYRNANMLSSLLDYFIHCFSLSRHFDTANWNFNYTIKPFLKEFTDKQFITLIEGVNSNNQIYDRKAAEDDNTDIVKYAKEKLGNDLDFLAYSHFKFKSEPKEQNSDAVDESSRDELPF